MTIEEKLDDIIKRLEVIEKDTHQIKMDATITNIYLADKTKKPLEPQKDIKIPF